MAVERSIPDTGTPRAASGSATRPVPMASSSAAPAPAKRVLRRAGDEEVHRSHAMRADEPRVRQITREKVKKHELKMKVSEAEWQFDRNKLAIYFTAERRMDFRELVKRLAAMNHYNLRLIKELITKGYDLLELHPS